MEKISPFSMVKLILSAAFTVPKEQHTLFSCNVAALDETFIVLPPMKRSYCKKINLSKYWIRKE
jgi:hypothetical protein